GPYPRTGGLLLRRRRRDRQATLARFPAPGALRSAGAHRGPGRCSGRGRSASAILSRKDGTFTPRASVAGSFHDTCYVKGRGGIDAEGLRRGFLVHGGAAWSAALASRESKRGGTTTSCRPPSASPVLGTRTTLSGTA